MESRMTEETKQFLMVFSELMKNASLDNVTVLRQQIDFIDEQANSTSVFNELDYQEFLVKNSNDGHQIPVTAYIPKNKTANTTIVIFYHGGGFQILTRKSYHRAVSHMARETNTIWLSVEYRLAPEFQHPIGITDCSSVTKWVLENKHELFGSAVDVKVGVAGDSAGGNLAVNVAHEFREKIAFQVLMYPWLDLTLDSDSYREFTAPCYILDPEKLEKYVVDYLNGKDRTLTSVSPVFHTDFNCIPKTLVVNSELDPLREDGRKYVDKLKEANIESEYYVIKGTIHGFFQPYDGVKNAFSEGTSHIVRFLKNL